MPDTSRVLISQANALRPLFDRQKAAFDAAPFPSANQRIADLKTLMQVLLDNQRALSDAMSKDFGHRSHDDSWLGDILATVMSINGSIRNVRKWMRPQRRNLGMLFQPATARVHSQPLGVVGILTPWNYPLLLSLSPLASALAAGNRVMVKYSELSPNTAALMANIIGEKFSTDQIAIIGGEADVAAALTSLPLNHIFFTGSTSVGKLVMAAAAKNLTPVTLELGGKSPAIIGPDMPAKAAVDRFIHGKVLNTGQTCAAPDYVFCPRDQVGDLIKAMQARFSKMYPNLKGNSDYSSIVSDQHYARLIDLIDDAKSTATSIVSLSDEAPDPNARILPLTLVIDPSDDSAVMQEEIFGPILPIIPYDDPNEVIAAIQDRPRPLALYIYSNDATFQDWVLKNTHAGGTCINEAVFHLAVDDLPFGGVGASGMGSCHGREGFNTFSHARAVLKRGRISFAPLLQPPYNRPLHKLVRRLFVR